MALPSDADIPFILADAYPNTEWGMQGEDKSDYANLDWRDTGTTKPTEAELETAWSAIETKISTKSTYRQSIKTRVNAIAGTAYSNLTNAQLKDLMEPVLLALGGIDEQTGNINTVSNWTAARRLLDT
jgi:hypothetical protein